MAVATLGAGRHSIVVPSTLFIPGERFRMGSEDGRADERPVHEAEVRPVRMGRTPVTNMEYAWFLAAGRAPEPPWWKDPAFWDPEQPVVGRDLVRGHGLLLLAVRDARRPLAPAHGGGVGARVPRRARGAPPRRGGAKSRATRCPSRRSRGPWPVGRGTANGYGLLDPGTVVHEWCFDWYAADAYRTTRRYDPRGPETGERRRRAAAGPGASTCARRRRRLRAGSPRSRAPPTTASAWSARCRERRADDRPGGRGAPPRAASRAGRARRAGPGGRLPAR